MCRQKRIRINKRIKIIKAKEIKVMEKETLRI